MVAAEGRTRATVSAHEVRKSFGTGRGSRRRVVDVLRGVDLRVMPGEMVVIVGPSGSGKSTLLYCLSGLEEADAGSIEVMGRQVVGAGRGELSKTRRDCVGFIFQSYNLIPSLTAGENVSLPARLAGRPLTAAQTGAVLASVFGLPVPLCAALGYAAVFGSASNTLLAPALIGAEVFGWAGAPAFLIACAAAYVVRKEKAAR